MSKTFDFEAFKANAIEQLKAGVPLSGKDGVLAPLLENLLNSVLEGEMDCHLENGEREFGNRRNGHMSKQVQTSMGEVTINTLVIAMEPLIHKSLDTRRFSDR